MASWRSIRKSTCASTSRSAWWISRKTASTSRSASAPATIRDSLWNACSRRACFRCAARACSRAGIRCREPRDLKHHTLIHIEWDAQWATWPNWAMWLRAAGAPEVDAMRGLHLSQTSLALQAALDGHGVALGDSTLVADDLAARRLVRPFSMALKGPVAIRLSPGACAAPLGGAADQGVPAVDPAGGGAHRRAGGHRQRHARQAAQRAPAQAPWRRAAAG